MWVGHVTNLPSDAFEKNGRIIRLNYFLRLKKIEHLCTFLHIIVIEKHTNALGSEQHEATGDSRLLLWLWVSVNKLLLMRVSCKSIHCIFSDELTTHRFICAEHNIPHSYIINHRLFRWIFSSLRPLMTENRESMTGSHFNLNKQWTSGWIRRMKWRHLIPSHRIPGNEIRVSSQDAAFLCISSSLDPRFRDGID